MVVSRCIVLFLLTSASAHLNQCKRRDLMTPAGQIMISCRMECKNDITHAQITSKQQCINTSHEAAHLMKINANYTCQLGVCNGDAQCVPSGLYIVCWKPAEFPPYDKY
ncbi:uncharacterized protein LOC142591251 [Dermacentor variabilis]|uniref:uncharacterized protein LOC142591251 n=1 Tax=Dermacentor variabilis TaxID=34621 RepID=UPI003F5C13A9